MELIGNVRPHLRRRIPLCVPSLSAARCSAAPCLWTVRFCRVELQELNRCSIIKYERNTNSNRRLGRCDQNLPTFEGFVQIVDGKGDVRNGSDNRGHAAMGLEPDPFDSVGTRLKTGDVNAKVRDMKLLSPRLHVWNPDVVVPPSELGCHGRRLMVQSLPHRLRLCNHYSLSYSRFWCFFQGPGKSPKRKSGSRDLAWSIFGGRLAISFRVSLAF